MQLLVVPQSELPLNVWLAAVRLFLQPERFADMNLEYMALSAERAREDMEAPMRGDRPHGSTPAGQRFDALCSAATLRRSTARTFMLSLMACFSAVLFATMLGTVHPSLPWDSSKVLQSLGGGFALWGTLLAVDGPPRTWGGGSAAERVHSAVFTSLLTVGACLALVGTLM